MPAVPRAFLAAGAALYLLVLRRPDSLFAPTMWAEDGVIFFKGAVDHGASSLFDGYNGQFLLLQRTVALVAEPLPVAWQPAIYAVVALLVTVGSCSWVLSALGHADLVPGARGLSVRLGVHAGHGGGHRHADELPLVARGRRPRHRLPHRPTAATGAHPRDRLRRRSTALSGFAVLYGLPALLFRGGVTKSRHSRTLVAVAVTGLAIEAAYLIASPREGSAGRLTHIGADTTMLLVVKKVFGLAALGDVNFAQSWPLRQAPLWAWTITFVLLVLVVAAVRRAARRRSGTGSCAAYSARGSWRSGRKPRPAVDSPRLLLPGIGNRYFVPAIAAIYLLVLMATSRRRLRALVVATTAVLLLVGIASDYHLATTRPCRLVASSLGASTGSQQTCTVVIPPGWEVVITDRP